ncbi:MAG: VWA domain-containing protein [Gemmatimonadota bacterium]
MIFASPIFLQIGAGIVVLVVLGLVSYARRRRKLGDFLGGRRAGVRLVASDLNRVPWARIILLVLAAGGTALAAAEPRWVVPEPDAVEPAPIRETIVAIDVSASMQAADGAAESSRLAGAVGMTETLLDLLPDHRVGLLLFAGQGYPLAPPTEDHEALRYLLSGVVPTIASAHDPGTLHSIAIAEAEALFGSADGLATDRAIVVIGDGEAGETEGAALAAVRATAERGVRIHAVGVGTVEGAGVVMPAAPYQLGGVVVDENRRPVVSRLREETLIGIAAAGGGRYARADDTAALDELLRAVARPETVREAVADAPSPRRDPGPVLALTALLLLCAESLFDMRPFRPRTRGEGKRG